MKRYHPNRKVVFQPPFFRGYVKLRGWHCFLTCGIFWSAKFFPTDIGVDEAKKTPKFLEQGQFFIQDEKQKSYLGSWDLSSCNIWQPQFRRLTQQGLYQRFLTRFPSTLEVHNCFVIATKVLSISTIFFRLKFKVFCTHCVVKESILLGSGFKHVLFSPLPGEMIQFD